MAFRKNYQCIMLELPDRRHLFTDRRNYKQLIEFARTSGSGLSLVEITEGEVLSLSNLALAICDSRKSETADFQVLEVKIPRLKRTRKKLLSIAKEIRGCIKQQFLDNKTIEINKLVKKFEKHNLSAACLSNHLRLVKEELEEEGRLVLRKGRGKYSL